MPITIKGYITEQKLAIALKHIVENQWVGCEWVGEQVTLTGAKFRWDMAFRREGKQVLVEFDGDEHYRNSMAIKNDRAKDHLAGLQDYSFVRIPYYVQLTSITALHYFGFSADIQQEFAHGFITTRFFPASFCELGIQRFRQELSELPTSVREAIIKSLSERIAENGREYVLPSTLNDLVP